MTPDFLIGFVTMAVVEGKAKSEGLTFKEAAEKYAVGILYEVNQRIKEMEQRGVFND